MKGSVRVLFYFHSINNQYSLHFISDPCSDPLYIRYQNNKILILASKVNNALYDLIQSLSKSEKRYFKVLSSRHTIGEENTYVRLFDYIDQMSHYDEDQLFRDFNGEAFLNRFSITKKRLYDNILNALDAYYSDQSENAQLFKMLHASEILFNKSLYDQARRQLISAEKLAKKSSNEFLLVLINEQKKRLIETVGYATTELSEIEEIVKTTDEVLSQVAFYNKLWNVKSELFKRLLTKGLARSKQDIEAYEAICSPVFDEFKIQSLNNNVVYLINHIRSIYHYALGELDQSLYYLRKNIEFYTSNTEFQKREPEKYISVLTNAVYIADRLGKHTEALKLLGALKRVALEQELNENLRIKVFSTYQSIQLSLELRMGNLIGAEKLIPEIENGFSEFGDKINPTRKAFLAYKVAVIHLTAGKYSESMKWLNKIFNELSLDSNEDIIAYAHLLELIIYIEQGKEELLKYKLKNTERYFKKRQRLYTTEKIMIDFIQSWSKSEDHFDRIDLIDKLSSSLKEIDINNPRESLVMDYFDLISWCESKKNGRLLSDCIRERYNAHVRNAS